MGGQSAEPGNSFWPLATLFYRFRNALYWESCRSRRDVSLEYHIGGVRGEGSVGSMTHGWGEAACRNFIDGKLSETNYGSIRFVVRWSWGICVHLGGQLPGADRFPDRGLFDKLSWLAKTNCVNYLSQPRGGVCDSRETGFLHFDRAVLRATWS